MKNNRLIKIMFSVSGVILIAKIFGFIKQMIVASMFGATIETDLISLSEGLIVNIEYVISQTVITAFVPIYIHTSTRSENDRGKLVSETIKFFLIFISALSLLIILFAPIIAEVIAPSYTDEFSAKLVVYLRIFSPLLIFYMLQAIFHALLNANEHFVPGQLIGLNQSIILIILSLLIGKSIGVNTLVIGFFSYSFINVCYLGFFSHRYWKFRHEKFEFNDDLRRLIKMMMPLLLGYAVVFLNQQVDKIIVSGMPSGTVTAMGYGATLSNFVTTMIGAVCSVIYTRISTKAAKNDSVGVSKIAEQSTCLLISILLPVEIITILCSKDIVTIVFGRGAFDVTAVSNAAYALAGYSFMFVPHAIKYIFCQIQYSYKNTRRPMINNSLAIGCNIIFSLMLYRSLGVFGVTLASSISELVASVLNVLSAKKTEKMLNIGRSLRLIPLWMFGSILCIVIIYLCNTWFNGLLVIVRFFVTTVMAFLAYAIVFFPSIFRYIKRAN